MATQLETFRFVAPEMAHITDETVLQSLSLAALHLEVDRIPVELRGLALVYKAASMIFDRGRTSEGVNTGTYITMEKEGDLQRTYAEGKGAGANARNSYELLLSQILPQSGGIMVGGFGFHDGTTGLAI